MLESHTIDVAKNFGFNTASIESLTEGLIHKTYKAVSAEGHTIILQQINSSVFTDPKKIIENYQLLFNHLQENNGIKIPAIINSIEERGLYLKDGFCWRAFEYIPDSYTENLPATREKIFSAAECYGTFVRDLFGLDGTKLIPTIPGFHDLNNRFKQFLQALQQCKSVRMAQSHELISKIEERKHVVDFYNNLIHD